MSLIMSEKGKFTKEMVEWRNCNKEKTDKAVWLTYIHVALQLT